MRARIILIVALLSGCGSQVTTTAGQQDAAKAKQAQAAALAAAAAKVKANELGQVPVLMYHRIVPKPGSEDDRTPAQFRTELERLATDGYVPITAAEYVTGKIDIPAGKHPVVLTFDDSSPSQLTLDEMGVPQADTAVAILQETAAKHPGFRPVGTFYVTRDMFGKTNHEEQTQMLVWLKEHGFDIGNHTLDHVDLRKRSQGEVTKQISSVTKMVSDLVAQKPVTLALPYGNLPSKAVWAQKGNGYQHQGVFLAGYTPGQAPFSKSFDLLRIPRIKAMDKKGDCAQFCSTAWLDWLKANQDMRYTSDGNPNTVAFPKFKTPFLRKDFTTRAVAY